MDESRAEEKVPGAPVTESDAAWYAKVRTQHLLAADGLAEGQCEYCGSYRADGSSPRIHKWGCWGQAL